jgi:hypothetical protein
MRPPCRSCPNVKRRRARSILGLILCAITYTALWDIDESGVLMARRWWFRPRRQLAYLDSRPVRSTSYGKNNINPNYQSFLKPSEIDGMMFLRNRRLDQPQQQQGVEEGAGESSININDTSMKNDGLSASCDNIFLFMPQSFAHHGHGSQLNNYILASLIASHTNRAMILLEAPRENNEYKSNSQFGCPPEAWETTMPIKGGKPKKIGWNDDFPNGLSRLIKHPAWLSKECALPCQDTMSYDDWNDLRLVHQDDTKPYEFQCSNSISKSIDENGEGKQQANVIVMGGREVRDYFLSYYRDQMLNRDESPTSKSSAEQWAMRVGASSDEAQVFADLLTDRQDIWDYMAAIMARSGLLRFQPWIARDVKEYMQDLVDLPLNVPYDAIHVRRGDKLTSDSRHLVISFWKSLGEYDEETGSMPQDYIPFRYYLTQFDESVACRPTPRIVYVATDDVLEVKNEVNDLPKDSEGNTILTYGAGGEQSCHKFRFIFSRVDPGLGLHISTGPMKGSCEDRYARNIASIADLMILAKSDVLVGEYNSNWGRLIRLFRLRISDRVKIENGARPVTQRGQMLIAIGRKHPGPPGW